MIGEGEKYVLIRDSNTFIYDHTLHHGRKHVCPDCLQAFRTTEKLTCHIKDCFKINGKETKIPKKGEYIKFKNYERKIKSSLIYVDFESILVPEDNGKRKNLNESYINKYEKHVACSYD